MRYQRELALTALLALSSSLAASSFDEPGNSLNEFPDTLDHDAVKEVEEVVESIEAGILLRVEKCEALKELGLIPADTEEERRAVVDAGGEYCLEAQGP